MVTRSNQYASLRLASLAHAIEMACAICRALDQWLDKLGVRPIIVSEFEGPSGDA
jgi:hypothetical protein